MRDIRERRAAEQSARDRQQVTGLQRQTVEAIEHSPGAVETGLYLKVTQDHLTLPLSVYAQPKCGYWLAAGLFPSFTSSGPGKRAYRFSGLRLRRHLCLRHVIEPPPIGSQPLSLRSKVDDQVLNFGRGHQRLDIVPAGPTRPLTKAQDLAATAG